MTNIWLLLLLAIIWGGAFLGIKVVVGEVDPFFGAATRILIGGSAAYVFALIKKRPFPRDLHTIGVCALFGLTGLAIPWASLFWGQRFVAPAIAAFLNGSVPLFITIISIFWLQGLEQVTIKKALGIFLGLGGIASIFLPQVIGSGTQTTLFGLFAILNMAIFYAINAVLLRKFGGSVDHFVNLAIQCVVSSIALYALSMATEGPLAVNMEHLFASPKALVAIAYLGFFCLFIAMVIFFDLIRRMGVIAAGSVAYLIPVVALLLDWFIFKLLPNRYESLGAALIISGVFLIQRGRGERTPVSTSVEPLSMKKTAA